MMPMFHSRSFKYLASVGMRSGNWLRYFLTHEVTGESPGKNSRSCRSEGNYLTFCFSPLLLKVMLFQGQNTWLLEALVLLFGSKAPPKELVQDLGWEGANAPHSSADIREALRSACPSTALWVRRQWRLCQAFFFPSPGLAVQMLVEETGSIKGRWRTGSPKHVVSAVYSVPSTFFLVWKLVVINMLSRPDRIGLRKPYKVIVQTMTNTSLGPPQS